MCFCTILESVSWAERVVGHQPLSQSVFASFILFEPLKFNGERIGI
jgi:hypothetical protein